MCIRKRTLCNVPLFCLVAGMAAFHVVIPLINNFGLVTHPDGAITSDQRVLISYGIVFLITLLIGGLAFFRNMTRLEIFFSASIIAACGVIMTFMRWALNFTEGLGTIFFFCASQFSEWSSVVPLLLYRLNNSLWLGTLINFLMPYIFVLFGRRTSEPQPRK